MRVLRLHRLERRCPGHQILMWLRKMRCPREPLQLHSQRRRLQVRNPRAQGRWLRRSRPWRRLRSTLQLQPRSPRRRGKGWQRQRQWTRSPLRSLSRGECHLRRFQLCQRRCLRRKRRVSSPGFCPAGGSRASRPRRPSWSRKVPRLRYVRQRHKPRQSSVGGLWSKLRPVLLWPRAQAPWACARSRRPLPRQFSRLRLRRQRTWCLLARGTVPYALF